jgi:hypothetical protein
VNYKIVLLSIYIFLHTINCLSQNLCLRIDSIKIYSIPWNMRTVVSLEDDGVRNFDDSEFKNINLNSIKKIKTIKDSSVILEFSKLNLNNPNEEITINDIDARMVVDIFINTKIFTLSLDGKRVYRYMGKYYIFSRELNTWIDSYLN